MAEGYSNGSKNDSVGNGVERSSRTDIFSRDLDPAVTAFITDFLKHKLMRSGFHWKSAIPEREDIDEIPARAAVALRSLADEFASLFKPQFKEMCDSLTVFAANMRYVIEGIADELFLEGIKWNHIVALFVFGGELALHCMNRDEPELIDLIAKAISWYISQKLATWIEEQGGWMILCFELPLRLQVSDSIRKILRRHSH